MAARLWTSGWDFFAPTQTVLFHLWKRSHRPSFRETCKEHNKRTKRLDERNSREKVLNLLTKHCDSDRYGLGHVRKLCDFESRLGVSFESRKILRRNVDVSNETFNVTDLERNSSSSSSDDGAVSASLSSSDKLDILRKLNISI